MKKSTLTWLLSVMFMIVLLKIIGYAPDSKEYWTLAITSWTMWLLGHVTGSFREVEG
ncbi:MAG: hypothetical protein J6B01_04900 [Ruminococcus sp.]|nr:hypothetical protein [Ruminococcus sp.]MBO5319130.1 hypothetical protein [Ruminococcus sp.]